MWVLMTTINFILVAVINYQEKQIKDLEFKTLDAFRIVCQKLQPKKEEK